MKGKETMTVESENSISDKMAALNNNNVDAICELLRQQEMPIIEYLADFVAALCDVNKEDMLGNTDRVNVTQARWLFWYAYRFMTNEPYEKIAQRTAINGYKFSQQGITNGANKMSMMIEQEPIWRKRWTIVKRIIKAYDNDIMGEDHKTPRIIIKAPKELVGRISIEYLND
jgi:chromosomal replication initiation ATPase DnaA